jgi:hypothetical protein
MNAAFNRTSGIGIHACMIALRFIHLQETCGTFDDTPALLPIHGLTDRVLQIFQSLP